MHFKKHKVISAILAVSLITPALCSCGNTAGQNAGPSLPTTEDTAMLTTDPEETTSSETTVDPGTYETAPDTSGVNTDFVRTADYVTPEMMSADYWISEEDNKILMTDDEIKAFNHENRVHIKAYGKYEMPYFDEIGDTFDGELLRIFLQENSDAMRKNPTGYYLDGSRTTKAYIDELIELSNIDGVPDEIKVRYGFTVKRMTLRALPTEDRIFSDPYDQLFDANLYSECMPYMPVYVLHESLDGEYLYVVFDSFSSWVRKDAVALCESREDWLARQNPAHWLTVTAREIRLGNDPYSDATTNLVLPMGTKMELIPADEAPDVVSERTTFGDYVVKVPTRGSDGYVDDEYVLIPVSDDVTVGYLPYTSANVVRQAMKLQGDRYGWGGDLQANDCTGIVREIYRCFGILMPRVGQSDVTGVYWVDMSDMENDEKMDIIRDLAPGSLISFPGHMTIYLGTVDDIPYVISAVGTFMPPAGFSTEVLHPRTVVVSSLLVRTRSYNSWLSIAKTALTIKPE